MPQGRRAKETQGETTAPAASTDLIRLLKLQSARSSSRSWAPTEAAPLFIMSTEAEEADAADRSMHWRYQVMKTLAIGSLSAEEIRRLVNDAAQRTVDPDIQRAARAFRQQSAGRKAKNDRAAIAEAELGVKGGSRSEWAVLLDIAQKFCPSEKPRSAAERLRRKLRKKHPRNSFRGSINLASSFSQLWAEREGRGYV